MSTFALRVLALLLMAVALSMPSLLAGQAEGPSTPPRPGPIPGIDWSKAEPVVVGLSEYQFVPGHIVLHRGVPYRLRLENRGTEIHDFTAPEFFKAVTLADPDLLASSNGNIIVKPHEHQQVDLVAPTAGSYPLRCADHDWAGMTGQIIVE
jgi:uncharacterized cupredoxin-like copper-binding protein